MIPRDRAQRSHHFRVRHLAGGMATFVRPVFCAGHTCVSPTLARLIFQPRPGKRCHQRGQKEVRKWALGLLMDYSGAGVRTRQPGSGAVLEAPYACCYRDQGADGPSGPFKPDRVYRLTGLPRHLPRIAWGDLITLGTLVPGVQFSVLPSRLPC